MHKASSR